MKFIPNKAYRISETIRNRRIELGMSQQELAEKVGYKSRSTINKIELGINDIPRSKIDDFAVALKTTPAELMGWEEKIDRILQKATEYLEEEIKLHKAISEKYGQEALDILGSYINSNDKQKSFLLTFSYSDEHTQELFSKYMQLDARGQKAVESVLLSELNSIKDSRK